MDQGSRYTIKAFLSTGRSIELPIHHDRLEPKSKITKKRVPREAKDQTGFITLRCYIPGSTKSCSEKFLVVEEEEIGTDEYDAILGATAPSELKEPLGRGADDLSSFPIGLEKLTKEQKKQKERKKEESEANGIEVEKKQKEQDKNNRDKGNANRGEAQARSRYPLPCSGEPDS